MKPQIGLIGLGLMGHPMAHNLLKSGYALTVYNRTVDKTTDLAAAGAKVAVTRHVVRSGVRHNVKPLMLGKFGIPVGSPKFTQRDLCQVPSPCRFESRYCP